MKAYETKILVDTSVWIEFLTNQSSPWAHRLDEMIERDEVALTPLIKCEILVGIRSDSAFKKVASFLEGFSLIEDGTATVHRQAVDIYRVCRKKGMTIRTLIDCIVAAAALDAGVPLLARDRDYAHIQRVFPLELV